MDPITATVIWGVVWFFLMGLSAVLIWGMAAIGLLVADEGGMAIGGVIGWLLGIAWSIFCIIQVVLHIIDLVRHLSG